MPTDDPNIELLLDFSRQQDELIAGHQKEMSQVLANKEHLRMALAREHNRANQLEEEIQNLKAQLLAISEKKYPTPNRDRTASQPSSTYQYLYRKRIHQPAT